MAGCAARIRARRLSCPAMARSATTGTGPARRHAHTFGALGDQTRAALAAGLPLSQAVEAIAKAMQPLAGRMGRFRRRHRPQYPRRLAELEWE